MSKPQNKRKVGSLKAISVLISTIIVIGIIVTIAAMVGTWTMNLARRSVNNTGGNVNNQITCQNMAYDFDSSYGTSGAEWDFSGSSDWMRANIMNTGTISIHSLSFQVYIQGDGYRFFPARSDITAESPLKPGQSAVLQADIGEDLSGQVTQVSILNGICRDLSATLEF